MRLNFSKISENKEGRFIEYKGAERVASGKVDVKVSVGMCGEDGDLDHQIEKYKLDAIAVIKKSLENQE